MRYRVSPDVGHRCHRSAEQAYFAASVAISMGLSGRIGDRATESAIASFKAWNALLCSSVHESFFFVCCAKVMSCSGNENGLKYGQNML